MAGAGYKLFNTGDVLTAAQVNTYLMEQSVMVFDDAAARTTALSGVVSEGMLSYLKDTNAVEVYDGSSWVASDDPNAIQNTIVDAKGDLIAASADNVPARLAAGTNEHRLVADSGETLGLKYVADTTNYAIAAKGDLLAGTAADTLSALTVGANFAFLQADSSTSTGLVWDNTDWTSYTPTFISNTGTLTSASATGAYKRIGKVCVVSFAATIVTNGTGGGSLLVSLPFTGESSNSQGVWREVQSTGNCGVVSDGGTYAVLRTFTNGYPGADTRIFSGSLTYEVQ